MDSVTQVAQRILEENAEQLAGAQTPEAVEKLAPRIAREIEKDYNPGNDRLAYMSVIVILGLVLVVVSYTYANYALTPGTVVGGEVISRLPDLPDALIALGSAAIGALAGLLAPTPRK